MANTALPIRDYPSRLTSFIEKRLRGNMSLEEALAPDAVVPRLEGIDWARQLLVRDEKLPDYTTGIKLIIKLLSNKDNLCTASQDGLPELVMNRLRPDSPQVLNDLARLLLLTGISVKLQRTLMQRLLEPQSSYLYRTLEEAIAQAQPPHYNFDTEEHGYASIEFKTLPKTFPPPNSGYTFYTWLHIERASSDMHMTIFGVFDSTQKSFTMAYLERGTNCLILQSSLKTSMRFKYKFEIDRWYNLTLTHKKARGTSSSKATLFVDGEVQESLKIPYPAACPSNTALSGFVGSLRQFASTGSSYVKYSLGHTMLVGQILIPELVFQYFKLGPEYTGNYQDYLTSYMTYEASSELKVKQECAKSSEMPIKNSELMPEQAIIFALSGSTPTSQVLHVSGYHCSRDNLNELLASSPHVVVLNKAIVETTDAIEKGHGVGILAGGVSLFAAQSFLNNIYKIGGMSILLYLVEKATSKEDVFQALQLCFSTISQSYINSEDFEKSHGYEILGKLLKEKDSPCICEDLLASILKFVGLEREFLINPMAYRYLVADFSIWSKAEIAVQRNHLNQFLIFSNAKSFGSFNNNRLSRINVIKKFLAALRTGVAHSMLPYYLISLKGLLKHNFSTDNIRAVSSAIVFMLHKKGHQRKHSVKISSAEHESTLPPTKLQSTGSSLLDMLEGILCERDSTGSSYLDKFACTITNRWSLLLLSRSQTRRSALRILSRLLVTQGRSYVTKFGEKNDGFAICQALLMHSTEDIWPELLAILFGKELRAETLAGYNNLSDVLEGPLDVVVPEIFPAILSIIQERLWSLVGEQSKKDLTEPSAKDTANSHARRASLDSVMGEATSAVHRKLLDHDQKIDELTKVLSFLVEAHETSKSLRDLCLSDITRNTLINILYPLRCHLKRNSNINEFASAKSTEFRDTAEPQQHEAAEAPALTRIKESGTANRSRAPSLRRSGSSFILLGLQRYEDCDVPIARGKKSQIQQPRNLGAVLPIVNFLSTLLVRSIIEGIVRVTDMVVPQLQVLDLQEAACFVTFWSEIQSEVATTLKDMLIKDKHLLITVRPFTNLCKYLSILYGNIEEGNFVRGEVVLSELVGEIMEYLQRPEVNSLKAVRICDNSVNVLQEVFHKLILLRLSNITTNQASLETRNGDFETLQHILYFQQSLFYGTIKTSFLRHLFYHLYRLTNPKLATDFRLLISDVLRCLLFLQTDQAIKLLEEAKEPAVRASVHGWERILSSDSENFLQWLDTQRDHLDQFFLSELGQYWAAYATTQNKLSVDRTSELSRKRKSFVKLQVSRDLSRQSILVKYESTSSSWYDNVVQVETGKVQKGHQDAKDNLQFIATRWSVMRDELTRENAIFSLHEDTFWRLDHTECSLRQRKKLRPMKYSRSVVHAKGQSSVQALRAEPAKAVLEERDYEIVSSPVRSNSSTDADMTEDKNRRVLRSLDIGDEVREVYNVSRIAGLNAIEGLLILGDLKMYIIDNYFNRSDNEICDVWDDSVQSQRDPILQILAGQDTSKTKLLEPDTSKTAHQCRTFAYDMLTSASKRQFLFRDVALELFFSDGRNHLITLANNEREIVHKKILERSTLGDPTPESSRKDTVATFGSFGSKFLSVFTASPATQAANRWEKREISNFEYLMILNSLAGRSYNDLTQYPVMPWVLADYRSESLDLSKASTFRDLSRNMGSQTSERKQTFQERYDSFASAGIEDTKPFHFGTHYSSAMIVCSFLIRLVPFVDSYLLLQGGHFDHPDRLFYSIEKAWLSASRENMTDVRELSPEWFYLPEFLRNSNNFDFGTTQATKQKINDVTLPPWAHGSPEVFIQKHREALESEYVSQRLHLWIDLIFGYKQLGMFAVEATNVFHSLSYHGAIDLDSVRDPLERLATIGIIHNFGQTPRQVFSRPHVQRGPPGRHNLLISRLAHISPRPLKSENSMPVLGIDVRGQVHAHSYNDIPLQAKLGFTISITSTDGSLRIKNTEGQLVGLFSALHTEPILHCHSQGKSIVLASQDTTLSVLRLSIKRDSIISLQAQTYLRGHLSPISSLATSSAFSLIVSGDDDGLVLLFDLNRAEYVRKLLAGTTKISALAICDMTGNIAVCTHDTIQILTVNGVLLAAQKVVAARDMVSCRFHVEDVLLTGHAEGRALIWKMQLDRADCSPPWKLSLVRELQHPAADGSITSLANSSSTLYTGSEFGVLTAWTVLEQ